MHSLTVTTHPPLDPPLRIAVIRSVGLIIVVGPVVCVLDDSMG